MVRSGTHGHDAGMSWLPTPPTSSDITDLADLYRRHFAFVTQSVRRMGVPAANAEDVAQDVFLVARRRLSGFEGRSTTRTWLFGIARRVAKDHRRSGDRLRRRLEKLAPADVAISDAEGNVVSLIELERLEHRLGALDDNRRAIYMLVERDGMTAQEVASQLGMNINTVYSRLRSARIQLDYIAAPKQ
jgi:RNA polymerase sigma-70 factor (ECF subfamily)